MGIYMEDFVGERLKKLRIEEGISEKELADILKVKKSTIKEWEKGTAYPTPSEVVFICLHFKVWYKYFLGLSDSRQEEDI